MFLDLKDEILSILEGQKEYTKTVALYGGGFKPPTKGHYAVVELALKRNPNVDEMIIYIGNQERDGVTQDESEKVWEIYAKYLPYKVKFEKVASPIRSIFDYAKNNPDEKIIWIIGAREGNEEDFKDIATRTKNSSLRPNVQVETIITAAQISGTAARNALNSTIDKFKIFLPKFLKDDEVEEIYSLLKRDEGISENLQDREDTPNLYNLARKYEVGLYKIITNLLKGAKIEMNSGNVDNEEMAMNQAFNMISKDLNYYDGNPINEISLTKASEQIFKLNPNVNSEEIAKDFIRLSPNLDKKDLFQYKTYSDLEQALTKASNSKTQRHKQAKSMDLEDNKFIFYKDDNFTIYKLDNPSQHPESCEIAQGAKICVASNSKKYWDQYMIEGEGILFYIRNKKYEIPHEESVIAFMFPRKGLKIGNTEMVDYNDDEVTENGNYKEQKSYLKSIGLPSNIIEKIFEFVPKSHPLSHYIKQFKGKKQKIKINNQEYFIFSPEAPPNMDAIVFEDSEGKIVGVIGGKLMWNFIKFTPLQKRWLEYKFPNLPKTHMGLITHINRWFDEDSKEIDLYDIQNGKLIKKGKASLPYSEKEINILISGGKLEVPEKFRVNEIKDILLKPKVLNEEIEDSSSLILKYIAPLTKFMESEGLAFKPYPKIKLIKDDVENGDKVLGNTAHFNPNENVIVLYTYKRHPKDILRSYAHELIHVHQNVEDRLKGMSNTTNVNEDDYLEKLEREAYEKGNILFRKWTNSLDQQSLNEGLPKNKWEVLPSPKPYSDELINLVQTAYKNTPEGSFVNTTSDLVKSNWVALDFDDEPDIDVTIFYRNSKSNETWDGNKIQGIGHDGTREAINKVLSELEKLLSKPGNWVEASDALEHILYKMGVPYVKDENEAQLIFPNTNLEFTGDKGKYIRDLGSGGKAKETIFGNPKIKELNESTDVDFQNLEKVLDDMFADVDIDVNFTRHFRERVTQRKLTQEDIIDLMQKIHDKYGDTLADLPKNSNRVFTHLTKLIDIASGIGGWNADGLKNLDLITAFKRNHVSEPEFRTNAQSPKLKVAEKKDPFGLNAYTMELARLAENGV